MKKRLLIVLAITVLLSLTVFAACQDCNHEYETKWDGEKHWQECKLCHEKKDEAVHVLSWVATDATNHWQACSCGYTTTPAAHDDGSNADDKCDACGRDLHEHVYSWQSDVAEHWQACACGDATAHQAHVDVKNNETEAEGADGKCDACARENYAVTFNMQGHGAAVAAQVIYQGGKVASPETVADADAWKFGGWYKEAACEHQFDFANEVINGATVVYAKWTEDTTAGASKAHAYELTLDVEKSVAIQKDQVVYLAYTASLEGRYTVSLGLGTVSQKCTFTADKAQGSYDGEHSLTLDLEAGDKLYIALTCADELDADATASILIEEVKDEPLPQDYFLVGVYTGGSVSLEITDRADNHQKLIFDDNTYDFKYVGGSLDRIYFTQASQTSGNITYYVAHNANGTYTMSQRNDNGKMTKVADLVYRAPQEPVALNKLFGYYEPKNYTPGGNNPDNPGIERDENETPPTAGGITNGIIELYIYVSDSVNGTSVRYKQIDNGIIRYSGLHSATYDAEHNTLTTDDSIVITLNLAQDGSIESINVSDSNDINVYVRKSDTVAVPPESLPLEANAEYRGETHAIRTPDMSQLFGAEGYNGITVMSYDEETGLYTIAVNSSTSYFDTYKLTISQEKEIKLYREDGTTLLDTLTKYEGSVKEVDLVASADGSENVLAKDDFYQGLVYIKVTTGGWYKITDISEGLLLYSNVPETSLGYYEFFTTITANVPICLEEGTYLVAECSNISNDVSFTSQSIEAPKGMSEDNPLDYEEYMSVIVNSIDTYYVKYTATEAGTYSICAFYLIEDSGLYRRSYICYNIGGIDYGMKDWEWNGGTSEDEPWAIIEVVEGQTVIIALSRPDDYGADPEEVMVEIAEYVPVVKEAIFTEDQTGTYTGETSIEFWGEQYNYEITLTFDIYGSGKYSLDLGYGADDYRIAIKVNEDGTYSFGYNDFTVKFSFGDNVLIVQDDDLGDLTLEKGESEEPDVPDGVRYTGKLENGNDAIIVINGTRVIYYVDAGMGLELDAAVDINLDDSVHSIQNLFGFTHTLTISEDGNTVTINDTYLMSSGTLTKQAE